MPGSSGTGVHAPSGARSASARPCAAAVPPSAPTTTSSRSDRMGTEATARDVMRQLDAASAGYANYAMTPPPTAAPTAADAERLAARVVELERERKHLLAVIEILKEVSTSLHFIDILQAIARKLGEAFGLDRCSIFLAERGGASVRLVASYEDPTIRNYMVDLERYPELKRAMQTGETVFIPDATSDPSLKHVKGELLNRRVKSITVVPITWRGVAIGAIFLRTFRDGPTFSDEDVRFVQVVAALTAQALRNAHRYERLAQRQQETGETMRRMELERVALLSFLRRLLGAFGEREGAWAEGLLPRASAEELDRLVGVAMAVIQEEAKGR
ncbi:MAG: hypothetical protein DMD65_14915 [Gemmatimonadetes bacterium]|nr:MAG: hypothetical protein DMD65_14915 [Gemmatimonadota bacterium]